MNYDRDESFWEVVLPRTKDLLRKLDRNCPRSLHNIIQGAAVMQLQDNEFWEIVEERLIDKKLIRYLNLDQICGLVNWLGMVGRGSDELIDY